jgi:hypothetical protein
MSYDWRCSRDDGLDCRDASGALLSSRLTTSALEYQLQGASEGNPYIVQYTFELTVSKGYRSSSTSTTITLHPTIEGQPLPPLVTILPIPPKVNQNQKLQLAYSLETTVSGEPVEKRWSVAPNSASTPSLDLAAAAATSLTSEVLVVKAGSLKEGGSYRFSMTASQSHGNATAYLDIWVNVAPKDGTLQVTPTAATVMVTSVTISAHGWVDTDKPLWYQVKYRVVGKSEDAATLSEFTPSSSWTGFIPEAGLAEWGNLVTVYLLVRDALGAGGLLHCFLNHDNCSLNGSTPGIRRLVLLTLVLGTHEGKLYSASTLVLLLSASCSWDGGSRASAQLILNIFTMYSLTCSSVSARYVVYSSGY